MDQQDAQVAYAAYGVYYGERAAVSAPAPPRIVLPDHLPAQCFDQAAQMYGVEASVLVAIVKVESRGKPQTVAVNTNGSQDIGAAGLNTNSWVPYFSRNYGIKRESLLSDVCLSIRAAAYALRWEWNRKACTNRDIWCAVARYHHPNDRAAQSVYVPKVQAALSSMIKTGRF